MSHRHATTAAWVLGLFSCACAAETPSEPAHDWDSDELSGGAGPFLSVQTFGGPSADTALAVAIDASGNRIVIGTLNGNVDLGGGPLNNTGGATYIAKYSPAGDYVWAKLITAGITPYAVSVAASGAIFVTGAFIGQVDFGGGAVTSAGYPVIFNQDAFVAKYSPNGAFRWVRTFGGGNDDQGKAITVAGNGDVLIAGQSGTTDLGCGRVYSISSSLDAVVARFTAGGTCVWSKFGGSAGIEVGNGIAEDPFTGDVLVAGNYAGAANFGTGTLPWAGLSDIFLARYSSSGAPVSAHGFGASGDDVANALTLDASSNILIAGHLSNSVDFGGGPVTSAGSWDAYVAKFSSTGQHIWSRAMGGSAQDEARAVVTNAGGAVFVVGGFNGTASFGGASYTAAGMWGAFVAKYGGGTGAHRWSRGFGGDDPSGNLARDIVIDASGAPFAVGYFVGTIDFGGGPVVSQGGADAFLLSL